MKMIFWILIFHLFLLTCDDEAERYEALNKLRALGVTINPISSKPSTTTATQNVSLTFHAVLPLNKTVTFEPYLDDSSAFSLPVNITIDGGSASYADYAQFRYYTLKATMIVPKAEELLKYFSVYGYTRLHFGLKLTLDDGDTEKIIGDAMAYPETSEKLSWSIPTANILSPVENETLSAESTLDIKSEITNPNNEPIKIGWFVSGGEIENRRAKETKWKTPSAGTHTLILTIRGKYSRGFDIKLVNVITN